MKEIPFFKYHGTGNDFIIINNLDGKLNFELNQTKIANLCHRRFGIGADGLMILEPSVDYDFKMIYYNSDGKTSTMCGNGGRCICKLYFHLNPQKSHTSFEAIDGIHDAWIEKSIIKLKMNNVNAIKVIDSNTYELNTGSPHYVHFTASQDELKEIFSYGKSIRYSQAYNEEGINVNLVTEGKDHIYMATYERGVEDETYSCGTGVVAASLANAFKNKVLNATKVKTKGGNLEVSFNYENGIFTDIYLSGPAEFVFEGKFEI